MLIDKGANAKYICEQAGHHSIKVTYDTYGHLFKIREEKQADKLDEIFEQS